MGTLQLHAQFMFQSKNLQVLNQNQSQTVLIICIVEYS